MARTSRLKRQFGCLHWHRHEHGDSQTVVSCVKAWWLISTSSIRRGSVPTCPRSLTTCPAAKRASSRRRRGFLRPSWRARSSTTTAPTPVHFQDGSCGDHSRHKSVSSSTNFEAFSVSVLEKASKFGGLDGVSLEDDAARKRAAVKQFEVGAHVARQPWFSTADQDRHGEEL